MGFKVCQFGQFGTINAQHVSRYKRVGVDLIRPRNRSKLVEGSLFAIIGLLIEVKFITLHFIRRVW